MNTTDYRIAMGGDGPLAATWADKPHRLVYDLADAVDNLQSVCDRQAIQLSGFAGGETDKDEWVSVKVEWLHEMEAALRKAASELNVATSAKWQAHLDAERGPTGIAGGDSPRGPSLDPELLP